MNSTTDAPSDTFHQIGCSRHAPT